MYELNGQQFSIEELEQLASQNNITLDELISKNPEMKQVQNVEKQQPQITGASVEETAAPDMESSSEPGLLESLAARTARGFVSTVKGLSSAKDALVFNMYNLFDPDMSTDEKKALYNSIESFNMPGLGFFSTDQLESAEEYLSKYVRESGQSVLQEFKNGDYGSAAEAIVGGALESIPSLLAAFTGYGGIALFGASVAGNKFDEEFEANPEESLSKLSLNAVGTGAIEAGFEMVTRGLGKSLKLIPGEQTAKEAAKQLSEGATKAIFKKLGGAYASEGASEAATEVTSIIYDKITLDKDIDAGEAITRAVDAFAIGGFVGGTLGTVSAIGDRTTAARERAEFILAPIEYKEKTRAAAKEMSDLQKALQEEETQEGKEVIKKQIQNIENGVVRAKQANSINLKYLKGENLSSYASNVDQILSAEAVIKNKKSSQQAKDIAKNNIINLSKTNAEIIRQAKSTVANVNKEFAKDLAKDLDAPFNELNSEEDLENVTSQKIQRGEKIGGAYFQGQIYWNKNVAEGEGDFIQVAAASHEVLHPIINSHVLNKSNARDLTDGVSKLLTSEQSSLVDQHLMENYNAEKGSDTYYEEYFQAVSDLTVENQINFDKTAFQKIKEFFQKLLGRYNVKVGFDTSEEILEFVKQYSASAKKGKKLSKNLIEVVDKQKIQQELLGENEILKSQRKDLKDTFDVFVQNKEGQKKYKGKSDFANSMDQANAFNTIAYSSTLDGMIKNMAARDGINNIDVDSVKENLSMRFIQNFDPAKNESLFGWMTGERGALYYAYLDTKKQFAQEEPTMSLDVESGEVGFVREIEDVDDFEERFDLDQEVIDEVESLINPAEMLGPGAIEEVQEVIDNLMDSIDYEKLTFKSVKNLVADIVGRAMGITADKITDPKKNLSSGQLRSGQDFIYENITKILKILPKGAVTEAASQELIGTSTGMKRKILEGFYEKDTRRRTEAQGLYEFKLKDSITKKEALAVFGIETDGTTIKGVTPRSGESQAVKALGDMVGQLTTNVAVRKAMIKRGINPNKVQDVAAGKNEAMFSIRRTAENQGLNVESYNDISLLVKNILYSNGTKKDVEKLLVNIGFKSSIAKTLSDEVVSVYNNNKDKYVSISENQTIEEYFNDKFFEFLDSDLHLKDVLAAYGIDTSLWSKYREIEVDGKTRKVYSLSDAGLSTLNEFITPFAKKFTKNFKDEEATALFYRVFARPMSHSGSFQAGNSLFSNNQKLQKHFAKNGDKKIKYDSTLGTIKIQTKGGLVKAYERISYNSIKNNEALLAAEKGDLSQIKSMYNGQAEGFQNDLIVVLKSLKEFINESNLSTEKKKQFTISTINSLFEPTDGLARLAAKVDFFVKPEINSKETKYEFDHRPPINLIKKYAAAFLATNDISESLLESKIKSMNGGFAPETAHKTINQTNKSTDTVDNVYETKGFEVSYSKRADKSQKQEKEAINRRYEDRMAAILSNMDKRYTAGQTLDTATAKNLAATRAKRRDLLAPSADDFVGLLYRFLDKGELGEDQYRFFEDNLIKPFSKAYYALNAKRQAVTKSYKAINKENKEVVKKLKQDSGFGGFTFEQALRVWLFSKANYTPSGLNEDTQKALIKIVKNNPDIQAYGEKLHSIIGIGDTYWVEPDAKNWQVDTIKSDMVNAVEKVSRKAMLSEWIDNKNAIFSDNNMNKILATYGPDFKAALEDMLYRMENGTARPEGTNKQMNEFLNWIRGSVAVTMFFNTRSAILQQISLINFINWSDNNPIKAAAALANVDQYAKDWSFIFNSDYLKERRGGLKTDVNAADLADAIKKGGVKGLHARLLQLGFSFTQIGDSFAIATGGASFYRNRINKYLSQGMEQAAAERQAFLDFQEISEESQQSARPDRLAKQQTDVIGRVFLAFQNTPMQYTRIIVKAAKDLAAGRGDRKTNISKIVYYMVIQNIIFSAMQQAMFSMLFEDDEEENKEDNEKKKLRLINNVIDTVVRGTGLYGAVLATAKNTILKFAEQEAKQEEGRGRADHAYTMIEAMNMSPAIGIKMRQMYGSIQNYRYNKDEIKEMGASIDNPALDIAGSASAFALNVPLDRALTKVRNLKAASDAETETWARIALVLGWNTWNVGIEDERREKASTKVKSKKVNKRKQSFEEFLKKN